MDMITKSALKCGFNGGYINFIKGVVIDFPNSTKSKKFYLCIDAGGTGNHNIVMINGL
tara:strand:- start:10 stop:183 length:174 start_codon:yes stop_codon:yes gene_type:complete